MSGFIVNIVGNGSAVQLAGGGLAAPISAPLNQSYASVHEIPIESLFANHPDYIAATSVSPTAASGSSGLLGSAATYTDSLVSVASESTELTSSERAVESLADLEVNKPENQVCGEGSLDPEGVNAHQMRAEAQLEEFLAEHPGCVSKEEAQELLARAHEMTGEGQLSSRHRLEQVDPADAEEMNQASIFVRSIIENKHSRRPAMQMAMDIVEGSEGDGIAAEVRGIIAQETSNFISTPEGQAYVSSLAESENPADQSLAQRISNYAWPEPESPEANKNEESQGQMGTASHGGTATQSESTIDLTQLALSSLQHTFGLPVPSAQAAYAAFMGITMAADESSTSHESPAAEALPASATTASVHTPALSPYDASASAAVGLGFVARSSEYSHPGELISVAAGTHSPQLTSLHYALADEGASVAQFTPATLLTTGASIQPSDVMASESVVTGSAIEFTVPSPRSARRRAHIGQFISAAMTGPGSFGSGVNSLFGLFDEPMGPGMDPIAQALAGAYSVAHALPGFTLASRHLLGATAHVADGSRSTSGHRINGTGAQGNPSDHPNSDRDGSGRDRQPSDEQHQEPAFIQVDEGDADQEAVAA